MREIVLRTHTPARRHAAVVLATAEGGESDDLSLTERLSLRWRISQLRSEIRNNNAEIEGLEIRLGQRRKVGWSTMQRLFGGGAGAADGSGTGGNGGNAADAGEQPGLARERDAWLRIMQGVGALQTTIGALSEGGAGGDLSQAVNTAPALVLRAKDAELLAPGFTATLEQNLPLLEPHIATIVERFDDLEPHLRTCVAHSDAILPHCSPLLRHLDALLVLADSASGLEVDPAEMLPLLAPRLDALAPHVPLLKRHVHRLGEYRPALPFLLRDDVHRAPVPHDQVLANADILFYYLGWALLRPRLRRLLLLPGAPWALALLSRLLPKWPVRRRGRGAQSKPSGPANPVDSWVDRGVSYEAATLRYYDAGGDDPEVQASVRAAVGEERAERLRRSAEQAPTRGYL